MKHLQRIFWLVSICVSASLPALPAFAVEPGPARLVADLAPGSADGPQYSTGFTRVGNRSVYLHIGNEYYPTLWVTDGTEAGTMPIAVLCPPCDSAVALGSTGEVAFFRVSSGHPSFEVAIWRTDGTPAGTFPVADGFGGSPVAPALASITGGHLYFTACTDELGCELWSSDGSAAGTAVVGETVPGPESGGIRDLVAAGGRAFLITGALDGPSALWTADAHGLRRLREAPKARRLTAGGSRVFFLAEDTAAGGFEAWTSDGTAAGTRALTAFAPPNPFPLQGLLTWIDGRIWFTANDGAHGTELWSAGPQGGPRRLSDFPAPGAVVSSLVKAGDRVLFVVHSANGGAKLWSSRGDRGSTAPLSGCPGGCPNVLSALAPVRGSRFALYGGTARGEGFWVTDGTAAGTRLLERSSRPHELVQVAAVGGRALFEITNEYEVGELWITDGTAKGTFFVTRGGPSWSHYWGWSGTLAAGLASGSLVFPGRLSEEQPHLDVLWRSDGSPAGSRPILQPPLGNSSWPQRLTPFRDGLLLQSCIGTTWLVRFIQGTATTPLLSHPQSSCALVLSEPVALGETAVFLLYEETGISLWRTDGSQAGTAPLVPAGGPREPEAAVPFGGEAASWLYGFVGNGVYESQLWLTDGTAAGTRKHLDLPPNTEMYGLTSAGGRLWFFDVAGVAEDDLLLRPWVSDGTPAGTYPLTQETGDTGSFSFTEAGGRVFFVFGADGGPKELWSSDGTPAGTGPVASDAIYPVGLSAVQGRLYFAAARKGDPTFRLLPWITDGTGEATVLADVDVGGVPFALMDPVPFVELDGRVCFAASDPAHGNELWSTDGTPAGTARLKDIAPGLLGSFPRELTVWNGRLYFRARDRRHGMELWSSDGTRQGTRLVQDIAPGAAWSAPAELTAAEGGLYFSAHDGEHGRELWVVPEP